MDNIFFIIAQHTDGCLSGSVECFKWMDIMHMIYIGRWHNLTWLHYPCRKFKNSKDNNPQRAEYVLERMQKLYTIEREARERNLSFDQRQELRFEQFVPILKELEKWMEGQLPEVLSKSSIGQAIVYTLGLWPRLTRYTQQGQEEIDNNLVENIIRPVALCRKNYMFAGSHEAAQQVAIIYSFHGTCKINNIEPYGWLKNTLQLLPDHSIQKLDKLLPC